MTVKITLACTECKQRNYNTTKNKKNNPDRLEMKKYYAASCKKHTVQSRDQVRKAGAQWQTKPIRSRALWPELRTPSEEFCRRRGQVLPRYQKRAEEGRVAQQGRHQEEYHRRAGGGDHPRQRCCSSWTPIFGGILGLCHRRLTKSCMETEADHRWKDPVQ